MWIISTSIAAIITTAIWYIKDPQRKYKLNTLSLMLWGATLMMFVDGMVGFRSEGSFLDISLTPTMLAVILVIVAFIAWEIVLFITDPQGVFKKQRQTKTSGEKQLAEVKG
jgi:predicted secreted protein